MLLESCDGLAPEAVIPAKAGIQVLFLGPRFRGDDNQCLLVSERMKTDRNLREPLYFT